MGGVRGAGNAVKACQLLPEPLSNNIQATAGTALFQLKMPQQQSDYCQKLHSCYINVSSILACFTRHVHAVSKKGRVCLHRRKAAL